MNTNDNIANNTDRESTNRCNCPKCKGCAGTSRVCFNSRKLALREAVGALVKTVGMLLFLACFSAQGQAKVGVTLSEVVPADEGQQDKVSMGYLTVFSSTEQTQWGDGPYYYVHTGYRIFDANGKAVKWVRNHDDNADEIPEKVELAPGKYTIWAQSDKYGYVKIPVVIKLAQTAAIHLES
jgi:hypothetical protein